MKRTIYKKKQSLVIGEDTDSCSGKRCTFKNLVKSVSSFTNKGLKMMEIKSKFLKTKSINFCGYLSLTQSFFNKNKSCGNVVYLRILHMKNFAKEMRDSPLSL